MHPILEEQRAAGFPAFAGADIKGLIPLRESLLNELVSSRKRKGGAFEIQSIRIRPRNRIEIDGILKISIFTKALTVGIQLAPEAKVAAGQRLTLQIEGILGALAPLAQSAVAKFKPALTLEGNQAQIDIAAALAMKGHGNLAPMVRRIGLTTEPGILYIDFHIHAG